MKILHVSTSRQWRGGEQQIAYLMEQLHARQIWQALVAPQNSLFKTYCTTHGYNFYPVDEGWNPLWQFARQIARLSAIDQPDIVHLHDARAHTSAMLATTFLGMKTRLVVHRRVMFQTGRNIFSRYKYTHPHVKKIICISEAVKNVMQEVVCPEKLSVIHSATDCKRFARFRQNHLRNSLQLCIDTPIVGNVAALTHEKGWSTFVHTAAQVITQMPDIQFLIIGEGPERKRIESLINHLGIQKSVLLIGFRSDIEKILPELDILLFPSVQEGLGSTILDAFCCGVPVVASNTGGITELIIHMETGWLCPPGDATAFANAIVCLLKDIDMRKRLATAAQEKVQNFSPDRMAEHVLAVYHEVLTCN